MRTLKSPHGFAVANVDGGSLFDIRQPFYDSMSVPTRFGPFEDIRAFHRWLRRPIDELHEGLPPDMHQSPFHNTYICMRCEDVPWYLEVQETKFNPDTIRSLFAPCRLVV